MSPGPGWTGPSGSCQTLRHAEQGSERTVGSDSDRAREAPVEQEERYLFRVGTGEVTLIVAVAEPEACPPRASVSEQVFIQQVVEHGTRGVSCVGRVVAGLEVMEDAAPLVTDGESAVATPDG